MSVNSKPPHTEAERAELECVVEALAKWPRMSSLLRYMGERLFSGASDQINEYNIATEVFGRSKAVFNAGDDAIARVETHRLRRRLVEFYKAEGKEHPLQVSLPAGSYVPVFIHKSEGLNLPGLPVMGPGIESAHRAHSRLPLAWLKQNWKFTVLAGGLTVAMLGAYLYSRAVAPATRTRLVAKQTATAASEPLKPEAALPVIRLLAGYSGPPRTDSAGRTWHADQYYFGGGSWQRSPGFIFRTSSPFVFEHSRTGDFTYKIPLKPGSYEVHLFFSTEVRISDAPASFNVWINGEWVLRAFDINIDALGEDIADERVFRGISPGKNGLLEIAFSGVTAPATLNAIEVLPSEPHTQIPIRLIMQAAPLTDRMGQFWHPDNYFMNGRLSANAHPLLDSVDPDLFSGERYGHFTYALPVDTRGRYTLILHFAELYFGVGTSASGGAGSRNFKVTCNGQTLLDNLDIFREVGSLHELTKTFRHLKPSAQGKLNLTFEPIVNNATISGIEVLDESQ